jgi:hypothetical protein
MAREWPGRFDFFSFARDVLNRIRRCQTPDPPGTVLIVTALTRLGDTLSESLGCALLNGILVQPVFGCLLTAIREFGSKIGIRFALV